MDPATVHNVYFLGIGGIGMSSLARYFHAMGREVAGYDLTPSAITDDLVRMGIDIHFTDDINLIPERYLDCDKTLVVHTPAVPEDHSEYRFFQEKSIQILKRSEVLGILFNESRGLAVAGTHGKTSVSSMLAYIMDTSALGCTAFLGGILKNINSNLILNPESDWVVAEADEFDRSFLRLKPEISLVTWVDADHLDIYESQTDIENTFIQFLNQTKAGGTIILKQDIPLDIPEGERKFYTYSLSNSDSDFYARDIEFIKGRYVFDIQTPGKKIKGVKLNALGKTNVENAVAAAALAWSAGVKKRIIRSALSGFQGVKRRFDIQYQDEKIIYIDDYAHHPRELDAVIGSIKNLFPGRRLTGVFQPHLYSRTKDFSEEFARSLSALDKLILLDIYPAREKPIEGVSSRMIFDHVDIEDKILCSKEELLDILNEQTPDILLTMGAGDIDRFVDPIKKMMQGL